MTKRSIYNNKFDEYYTRYEHVEFIFDNYKLNNYCKNKIIYCPCDSDKSNFVIYLKNNKDKIQYKELIYTSDDYNTHYDLFEYCDIIITNPPFSKLIKEFIPILNKCNKEFFIFGCLQSLGSYIPHINKNVKFLADPQKYFFSFILPDNSKKNPLVRYLYITNISEIKNIYPIIKYNREDIYVNTKLEDGLIVRMYDSLVNIPKDYYEPILVPSSVYLEHHKQFFDILDYKGKIYPEDGRKRYIRVLVKRKKI